MKNGALNDGEGKKEEKQRREEQKRRRQYQRAGDGPLRLLEGHGDHRGSISLDRAFDQEIEGEATGRWGWWWRGCSGTAGWPLWPLGNGKSTSEVMVTEHGRLPLFLALFFLKTKT